MKGLENIIKEYERLLDDKAQRIATLMLENEELKKLVEMYKKSNTIYYFITTNGNVEGIEEAQNLASEINIIKD